MTGLRRVSLRRPEILIGAILDVKDVVGHFDLKQGRRFDLHRHGNGALHE
jgi:hypothetical protein